MARGRKRSSGRTRTRTIVKTRVRRIGGGFRRVGRSIKSKSGTVTLITTGIGSGALVSTGTQLVSKYTGFRYPIWLNPALSAVVGFMTGKHITHNNGKAALTAAIAAGTAFLEDHIISVTASPNGSGVSGGSIQVY